MLLSRLPYGKQTPMMTVILDPMAAARRGFMVVIQDTRGRFASEGEWEPDESRRAPPSFSQRIDRLVAPGAGRPAPSQGSLAMPRPVRAPTGSRSGVPLGHQSSWPGSDS
ncbi:CocE/NonD family hydrolase [Streptomyces sp. NPDC000070]|uniref:CocE/NonD family hydrolase n=1 Tax=Streptomyces sp. NPDC000070 TaxID=3154240 RepID=UPI00331C9D03